MRQCPLKHKECPLKHQLVGRVVRSSEIQVARQQIDKRTTLRRRVDLPYETIEKTSRTTLQKKVRGPFILQTARGAKAAIQHTPNIETVICLTLLRRGSCYEFK